MRLILHPKVYSDIDKIMEYYERVATPELADEFYASYGISWSRPRIGRNRFRFDSVTSAE